MSNDNGINRNLDSLGRIVIPKEWRKQLGLTDGDALSIKKDGRKIIVTKVSNAKCETCGRST